MIRQGPSRNHLPSCFLTDLADLGWVKPGLYLSPFYLPITQKKKEIQQKYSQICLLYFLSLSLFFPKPTKFAVIFVGGYRHVQADSVFGGPDRLLSAVGLPVVCFSFHICKALRTNTGGRATPAVMGAGIWKSFFHSPDGPNILELQAQGTLRRSSLLPLYDDKEWTVEHLTGSDRTGHSHLQCSSYRSSRC